MFNYRDFIKSQTFTKIIQPSYRPSNIIPIITLKTPLLSTLKTFHPNNLTTTVSSPPIEFTSTSPIQSNLNSLNFYESKLINQMKKLIEKANVPLSTIKNETSDPLSLFTKNSSNTYEFLQVILLILLIGLVSIILLWLCICTKKFLIYPKNQANSSRHVNEFPRNRNPVYRPNVSKTNIDQMLEELPRPNVSKMNNDQMLEELSRTNVSKTNIDQMLEELPRSNIKKSDSSRTIKFSSRDFISFKN
ncbi:unnamed protein product [Brachionus calyciflorus]|uniref:Uncharacterized protein n=1 Tax=Brachionus calyciflorus TaxID=104777 RepID=A0A814RU26_9BILA|nr:unnamed protein product [Brachionus calyciflorus]